MRNHSIDLFNSKTAPVPRVRPDIDILPVNHNSNSYIYFHDMRGYITPNFALERSAETILSLLDGRKSINDLKRNLGNGISTNRLLRYIQFLDKNRLLYSPHFKNYVQNTEAEYEKSTVHQPVTAGNSYPAESEELRLFLQKAFRKYKSVGLRHPINNIHALYAPHIDPRIGMKSYVQAFGLLKDITPKRIVILATSHYSGLYTNVYQKKPFIVSRKNFKMPLRTIPSDQKSINALLQSTKNTGLTSRDRAHRIEHSIELHLLFLSYIWQHDFSIIPVIIGGFDNLLYMNGSYLSRQVDSFSKRLRTLFGKDDNETFFLISGDLAHTGKKFGDHHPATTIKNEVTQFDNQFLSAGESGSSDKMLQLMKQDYDPYRICGFPPLYTFLKAFPNIQGQQINYERWDETERESAVTFGTIAYK